VGVELAGPLQVGQVTDVRHDHHLRVVQAADEFVGDFGGGVGVVVTDADQGGGAQGREHGPVVGTLGAAAQRRGGTQRVRRQHHVHDLLGERRRGSGTVQARGHVQRQRAHPLLVGDLRPGQPAGDLGRGRRLSRGGHEAQRPPAFRLGGGELHQDQAAHAQPDQGGPANAFAIQQVPDIGRELGHGHGPRGDRAFAVAAQVGCDDPEPVAERGELGSPHGAVERVAMQEHDDRAVSGIVIREVSCGHGLHANHW
jgi:hypothetical protein